jgi:2-polyprenyl-3-methyl-5-hydroxy-6-metoxy-1,4-benzoquinol methylase
LGYTGIEPSDKAKAIAITKAFLCPVQKVGPSFQVLSMWHVLEHVPDLEYQIKELKRLLKPSGFDCSG